jgi:hypothetical protein
VHIHGKILLFSGLLLDIPWNKLLHFSLLERNRVLREREWKSGLGKEK